jgi:hypothetical protein
MSSLNPPRPRLNLSVGITGHRPPILDDGAEAMVRPWLSNVLGELAEGARKLRSAHPGLFDEADFVPRFVSPLAEGADQVGAKLALELGYRLQAVLPLPREDYSNDFEPPGLARFELLLSQADCVLELPPQAGGRHESYALAGRATIAHCDVLIALWDGAPARGIGGTAEIVSLALRRGVPVIHLTMQPDDGGRILWTGYGDFVDPSDQESIPSRPIDTASLHQLVAAILGPPSDPRAMADLEGYLAEREWLVRPRAEYPLLLAVLGVKRLRPSAFSSERYEDATRREWLAFRAACGNEQHGVAAPLDDIERSFAWADRLAQHFGQTYRSGHVLNFTFGATAVLIALTGLLMPSLDFWLALAEPSVIAIFVANTLIGSKRQWHRRWLEYRQLAERVRPMRSLKLLGAASPSTGGYQDDLRIIRWTDWYAQAEWRSSGCPSGRLVDPDKLTKAIIEEELNPQIEYNRASAHQMHLLDHRLHQAGMILFLVSILSCLCSVAMNLLAHDFARTHAAWFIAASAGLPALGGAIFGIRMQGDFGTTAERSLITAAKLTRIAESLAQPGLSLARQTDLAEAAAATMLADLAEWRRAYERRTLQLG